MKILIFVLLTIFFKPGFSQVAIIANPNVPVDSLTKNKLLDLYSGEIRKWDNNQPIVTYDLKPKLKIRDEFLHLLGKTSSRMKSIWLKKMLAGEGDPPMALDSEESLLKKIARTPGAIGFISKNVVDNTVKLIVLKE
jgi:ABC-type phosphate transport system substrate-binding protein